MVSSHELCSLTCEVNFLRVRNLDVKLFSDLFIRCNVSIGGGRRIQIDSQKIPSSCHLQQNLLAVLECQGDANHMSELLEKHGVVFELRRRKAASLLGQFLSSKLIGRASVTWKNLLVSTKTSTERWITLHRRIRKAGGPKPPAILINMKIQLSEKMEKARRSVTRTGEWEECRCRHCKWNLEEEDMFALATAMVAC